MCLHQMKCNANSENTDVKAMEQTLHNVMKSRLSFPGNPKCSFQIQTRLYQLFEFKTVSNLHRGFQTLMSLSSFQMPTSPTKYAIICSSKIPECRNCRCAIPFPSRSGWRLLTRKCNCNHRSPAFSHCYNNMDIVFEMIFPNFENNFSNESGIFERTVLKTQKMSLELLINGLGAKAPGDS